MVFTVIPQPLNLFCCAVESNENKTKNNDGIASLNFLNDLMIGEGQRYTFIRPNA